MEEAHRAARDRTKEYLPKVSFVLFLGVAIIEYIIEVEEARGREEEGQRKECKGELRLLLSTQRAHNRNHKHDHSSNKSEW